MRIQTPQKQIIVTGSLAFDIIMNFPGRFSEHILPDKIHALNLSFLVDEMQKTKGGTAGNIAYNLGLLECHPFLLSVFGKDGTEYREFLFENKVNVSCAPISEKLYTSQSLVLTDRADNQITSFYAGAMEENENLRIKFSVETRHDASNGNKKRENTKIQANVDKQTMVDNNGTIEQLNNDFFVVISPNTPAAMKQFVNECVYNRVCFMYDPGMQLPRISDEDLKKGIENCEILIGNDYEVELMKKRVGDIRVPILIVTLGEKGAVVFDNRVGVSHGKPLQKIISPATPCKTLDPTGAGDAFRAGFLAGYVRGFDLKTCGQMGTTCAVYTVEKYGTTTHKFTIEKFCERYIENYGEKLEI